MEDISYKEKVDRTYEAIYGNPSNQPIGKVKKIKIPRRARVRKGKAKKGWIGIIKVEENGVISGEKTRIDDSVFTLKGGTYHVTDGREVLFWEGKYPVFVQETKSRNPKMFNDGENRTYGDKYILAKMLKDAIKIKNKGGNIILWALIIGGLFLGAKYIFKF